jgi:hypothetical protein
LPSIVNPKGSYSSEPAPMGVGDFGVTPSSTAYTYSSSAFVGTVQIRSISANAGTGGLGGNWVSFQLNVVLVLTHGGYTTAFWIQDVPLLNTSTRQIWFENNIWNLTNSYLQLTSGALSGNGSIYSCGTGFPVYCAYYADGPSSAYAGNGVTLAYPVNVSVEVVSSVLSGLPHVGFAYNDGHGWVTYDNVTFPWARGWTDSGFVVNGSSYNPFGTYYDAEMVYGGPGGGSTASNQASNMTISLLDDNGHNFQAVSNAWDFGGDTAETVSSVLESVASGPSPGPPAALVRAGPGGLGTLYGRSNVAIVNLSSPVRNGVLLVNGSSTSFRGKVANITLAPGAYHLVLRNGTRAVAAWNLTLSAGEYLALEPVPTLLLSPASGRGGSSVTASGSWFAPLSKTTVRWTPTSSSLCNATTNASGAFSCAFTVPAAAQGNYTVKATDSASPADSATARFTETTNLTVSVDLSADATDTSVALDISAIASGGYTPYASYAWSFGDGGNATTTSDSTSHSYDSSGSYTIGVEVTDRVGSTSTASVGVTINAPPQVGTPFGNRTGADVGQAVTFGVSATLGTLPYSSFDWSGLPSGCTATSTSSPMCALTSPMTLDITVVVTDAAGVSSPASSELSFPVDADPIASMPQSSRASADVGQSVTFTTTASLGSGGYSYNWSGLPTGCLGWTASFECLPVGSGTFVVNVTVTDSNGWSVTSASRTFAVYNDPTAATPTGNRSSADVGQSVTFVTVAALGIGAFQYAWAGLLSGCVGSAASVACTAAASGSFSITVTVTDANGYSTVSGVLTFTVFDPPVVAAPDADRTSADVGQGTTFTASVTDPGAGGDVLLWSLGPASSGTPPTCAPRTSSALVCTASAPGTYTVSVTVTDANGGVGSAMSATVTVLADPTVGTPSFTSTTTDVGLSVGGSVTAVGGSGGYAFAWGGLPAGCSGTTATIVCSPGASGTYQVTVTVRDSNGFLVSSGPVVLTVHPALSASIAGPSGNQTTGRNLSFYALAANGTGPYDYAWAFGDGATGSGTIVGHVYRHAGTYTVWVWVNDSVGASVLRSFVVTIVPAPSAATLLGLPMTEAIALLVLVALAGVVGAALLVARRRRTPPPV